MSETVKWSFSTDRCVRRCQRQYFLQHVAAWHNANDPLQREAFIAKQLKTLDLSQLCWPVPDRSMRLSIDLKLCDDYLRSIAATVDEEDGLYGETEADEIAQEDYAAVGWNG